LTRVGINSVTWSPHSKQDITRIEKVQRQFTKRLRDFKGLTYTEHLAKLDLPGLELRQLHLDLIYCYKIVFGLVILEFSPTFLSFPCRPADGMYTNYTK